MCTVSNNQGISLLVFPDFVPPPDTFLCNKKNLRTLLVCPITHIYDVSESIYLKFARINTFRWKARFRCYRLLVKGKFDVYLLWPFKEKMISYLVTHINARNPSVFHALNYFHEQITTWIDLALNSTTESLLFQSKRSGGSGI